MLNWNELVGVQNLWASLVEEELKEDGHYLPRVFLVTEEKVDEDELGPLSVKSMAGNKDEAAVGGSTMVCVPFTYDDPKVLLDLMSGVDPKVDNFVKEARFAAALIAGRMADDPAKGDAIILDSMCRRLKAHPKDLLSDVIRKLMRRYNAYAIFFLTEGWYAQRPAGEDLDGVQVKDLPGRLEVLTVHLETQDKGRTITREILRATPGDEGSPVTGFRQVYNPDEGPVMSQGRFAEWFKHAIH